jgi:hypothetical protein
MRRRWIIYLLIGALFGVLDFFYIEWLVKLFRGTALTMLNLGIWLVPVIPIALYEARCSRSSLRAAAASLATWCAAIVAYYLTNAVQLAFLGVPGRPELHISNRAAPYFWQNWASVFRWDILGGMAEWIIVAIVGGAIVGFAMGWIYLHLSRVHHADTALG